MWSSMEEPPKSVYNSLGYYLCIKTIPFSCKEKHGERHHKQER